MPLWNMACYILRASFTGIEYSAGQELHCLGRRSQYVKICCAGAELTLQQLLDRVRQAVQGAFANSELPSDQQVRAAGFAPDEERRIMPTFFALHDASFFTPPPMKGLEVRPFLCDPVHSE